MSRLLDCLIAIDSLKRFLARREGTNCFEAGLGIPRGVPERRAVLQSFVLPNRFLQSTRSGRFLAIAHHKKNSCLCLARPSPPFYQSGCGSTKVLSCAPGELLCRERLCLRMLRCHSFDDGWTDGWSIAQVLEKDKKALAEKDVVEIGIAMCNALVAIHDKHILHRDIKCDS